MTDWKAWTERVMALTEGSRDFDREFYVFVNNWKLADLGADANNENACQIYTHDGQLAGNGFTYPNVGKLSPYYHVPDRPLDQYSRNKDATLFLFSPRIHWRMTTIRFGLFNFEVWNGDKSTTEPPDASAAHKTEALAVLLTYCKAKAAEKKEAQT